ncbi:MAG: hypothetical protein HQ591_06335 [candidate division Zixibacteria bacterium]|nr:hypothetical protein [Candidatus Tariuqbacter arcticus]
MNDFVKGKIVIFLVIVGFSYSEAAFELTGDSIISLSLSGAGYAMLIPGGAVGSNPAVPFNQTGFSLTYRNLYNLKELRHTGISFYHEIFRLGITVKAFDFGCELYRENAFALSAAREVTKGLYFGLQIEHYRLSIRDYGSSGAYGFDLGCIWEVQENLSIAGGGTNLNRPQIGECSEGLPFILRAGLAYQPVEHFQIYADIFKDEDFPLETRLGVELSRLKYLTIRMGTADHPVSLSGGFDIHLNSVGVSYAFNSHKYLGFTHSFGMFFRMGD